MSYKSDNGSVAFGDPLEASEKRLKEKAYQKAKNEKGYARRKNKGNVSACREMHNKFG